MRLQDLRIWKNCADALDALKAANARAYHQPEPFRPVSVKSEGRWNGMIKYFVTRCKELADERTTDCETE